MRKMPSALFIIFTLQAYSQVAKKLSVRRAEMLWMNYLTKNFDSNLVKNVIPDSDSNVNLQALYYSITVPSATKFIAFFADDATDSPLKTNTDQQVTVFTNRNFGSPDFFIAPNTYCYAITGINHHGKWYYQKTMANFSMHPTWKMPGCVT